MEGSEPTDDVEEDLPSDSDSFLRAVAAAPDRPISSAGASDSLAAMDALERLAHFRIEEPIGHGGMGIVFRAEDEKLRRVVALKVLPRSFGDDEKRRRRFMREARLAASISHPNVATVYDVGEAEGRIFIAMELVSGSTLRRKLEDGPLSLEEARRVAIDIARGVARAHEQGIAHRDLKPDNVMVTSEGAIKVLDFGLAKPIDEQQRDAADSATLTKEGGIVGTPGYMSPEQATGRPLDVRTDVFSLGVILYEMVTGKRPFTGETSMDKLIATSRDEHVKASQVNPKVPDSLDRVIDRCLAKEPSARFATSAQLAEALQAANLDEARPGSPRSNARWLALGGMLAVGVVGAWALAHGRAAATPAAASETPAARAPIVTTEPSAVPSTTTIASAAPTTIASEAPRPVVVVTAPTHAHGAPIASAPSATASAHPVTVTSSSTPPDVAASHGRVIQSSPY